MSILSIQNSTVFKILLFAPKRSLLSFIQTCQRIHNVFSSKKPPSPFNIRLKYLNEFDSGKTKMHFTESITGKEIFFKLFDHWSITDKSVVPKSLCTKTQKEFTEIFMKNCMNRNINTPKDKDVANEVIMKMLIDWNNDDEKSDSFVVAGGLLLTVLKGIEVPGQDVDVYMMGPSVAKKKEELLINLLHEMTKKLDALGISTFVCKTSKSINIYSLGMEIKPIQFVLVDFNTLEQFCACLVDYDMVNFCYDFKDVYTTVEGLRYLHHDININYKYGQLSAVRTWKYQKRVNCYVAFENLHPLCDYYTMEETSKYLKRFRRKEEQGEDFTESPKFYSHGKTINTRIINTGYQRFQDILNNYMNGEKVDVDKVPETLYKDEYMKKRLKSINRDLKRNDIKVFKSLKVFLEDVANGNTDIFIDHNVNERVLFCYNNVIRCLKCRKFYEYIYKDEEVLEEINKKKEEAVYRKRGYSDVQYKKKKASWVRMQYNERKNKFFKDRCICKKCAGEIPKPSVKKSKVSVFMRSPFCKEVVEDLVGNDNEIKLFIHNKISRHDNYCVKQFVQRKKKIKFENWLELGENEKKEEEKWWEKKDGSDEVIILFKFFGREMPKQLEKGVDWEKNFTLMKKYVKNAVERVKKGTGNLLVINVRDDTNKLFLSDEDTVFGRKWNKDIDEYIKDIQSKVLNEMKPGRVRFKDVDLSGFGKYFIVFRVVDSHVGRYLSSLVLCDGDEIKVEK